VVNTRVRQANIVYKQTHHHQVQFLAAHHNHGTASLFLSNDAVRLLLNDKLEKPKLNKTGLKKASQNNLVPRFSTVFLL